MVRLILLSILQSMLLCGGQLLLKIAVGRMDRSVSAGQFIVRSILANGYLAGCGVLFSAAGLLWIYILRHFPFSSAYPLTALSFVFGALGAMCFLHESVSLLQWVGIALILVGCYCVAS